MKSTGMVRKVDELGRVVLPKEMRSQLQIEEKDSLEIFVEGRTIVLQKIENTCVFCENNNDLLKYKDKLICKKCLNALVENTIIKMQEINAEEISVI